jgi:hypothetical protein
MQSISESKLDSIKGKIKLGSEYSVIIFPTKPCKVLQLQICKRRQLFLRKRGRKKRRRLRRGSSLQLLTNTPAACAATCSARTDRPKPLIACRT